VSATACRRHCRATHLGVRLAGDEPQQLLEHAAQEDALRRQQRQRAAGEAERQAGLRREERQRAGARAVGPCLAGGDDAAHEGEVLQLFVLRHDLCDFLRRVHRLRTRAGLAREHACECRLGERAVCVRQHGDAAGVHLEEAAIGERQVEPARDEAAE
jgi:hypothetical protein